MKIEIKKNDVKLRKTGGGGRKKKDDLNLEYPCI